MLLHIFGLSLLSQLPGGAEDILFAGGNTKALKFRNSLLSQGQQVAILPLVVNKNSTPKLRVFMMSLLASPHIQKWDCGGKGCDPPPSEEFQAGGFLYSVIKHNITTFLSGLKEIYHRPAVPSLFSHSVPFLQKKPSLSRRELQGCLQKSQPPPDSHTTAAPQGEAYQIPAAPRR